jgi:uncharacterized protein YndB with AHSA1/START domain
MKPGDLKVAPRGDREILMTRTFHAPRKLVFQAFTKPEFARRWMLGPDGWSMPICEMDLRVGGKYRYVWRHKDGEEMSASGVFRELAAPERIVHTETFDPSWYAGECVITTTMTEQGGKTMLTVTLQYDSAKTRDAVLKSEMKRGVSASYNRLEEMLSSTSSQHAAS